MLNAIHHRCAAAVARNAVQALGRRWMSVRPEAPAGGVQRKCRSTPTLLPLPSAPSHEPDTASPARKKVTIASLQRLRRQGTPIAMLTAYDFPTGRATEAHGVDITLVGDSLAQVALGYESTTELTLDEMVHHTKAVRRGCKAPMLVADMPFGSYGVALPDSLRAAMRLMKEAGAEAVKLEGGVEILDTVRAMTAAGIPVMAHVGLLPQRHVAMSGYKVQGKDARAARDTLHAALALQDAGAFSIVLEAIPAVLGTYITERLCIPTIGIGAGPGTSGQVLVWSDVMGTWHGHKAKFVRRFADCHAEAQRGVTAYVEATRAGTFPDASVEGYEMDPAEWERFMELEGKTPTTA